MDTGKRGPVAWTKVVAEAFERRGDIQEGLTWKLIDIGGLDVGVVGREDSTELHIFYLIIRQMTVPLTDMTKGQV